MIASLNRPVTAPPWPAGKGGEPARAKGSRSAAAGLIPMEEVIVLARAGNEKAWICLYRCLAPDVRGYFAARGMHQPDDLTSEVFLEVARGIAGFQGDVCAFRTWVFTIAHSRLVDDIRRSQRRGEVASLEQAAGVASGDDVEGEVMGRLRCEELVGLLDRLGADQRDVVLLRVLGGLSVAEVAAVLDRSVTGVKVLHHRAIKAVRRRLEADYVTKSPADRLPD